MEKNQAIIEIQKMIRSKIIYPAQAKNITVYDTDGNIFMIWAMTGSIRKMWTGSYRSLRSRNRMCGLMHILTVTEIFWFSEEGFTSNIPKAG